MAGYGQRAGKKSQGIHDPLFAKALFLANDKAKLLFITVDLIGVPNGLAHDVTQKITQSTILDETQICIAASHTHSGPEIMGSLVQSTEVKTYLQTLERALVTVAEGAINDAGPCQVKVGHATVDFLINRRTGGNPNRVDDRSFAMMVETLTGSRGKAVLFGCGCHAVTLGHDNLLISADYPGVAQKIIEKELGVENALFFNMAEGNVIPDSRGIWDSLDTRGYVGGTFQDAENIGGRLAKAVIESLHGQPTMPEMFLATRKSDCVMKPNLYDLEEIVAGQELEKYQQIITEYLGEGSLNVSPEDMSPLTTLWREASHKVVERDMPESEMRRLMTAVCNYLVRVNKLFNPARQKPIHMQVQVIGIHKFTFLALPGEVLVENALDWQDRIQDLGSEAFVIGLANGFMGYLPHKSNFEEPDAEFRYETLMNALEPTATDVALEAGEKMAVEIWQD